MTQLSTLVEPLKRELAVPGTFDDVFPDTEDEDLVASLADGFAEAQLQGFFSNMEYDPETFEVTPALSNAGATLVVLFTGMRILRAQLRTTLTSERYSAKQGTSVELERSANLLRDELSYMKDRLNALIEEGKRAGGATCFVIDNYAARNAQAFRRLGGFFGYEV